ncbi:type IV pilus assembly protein FimV [Chitinilyticum litopenaei]|uniref:type IV pilus assembly protein FimV n=1 Tax=Chitinilyticum litopenaei TaxID=1121276 RepID=UPI001186272E|nr:tetratricopeptide repeat protein [Chitinilyticum litopenaei]
MQHALPPYSRLLASMLAGFAVQNAAMAFSASDIRTVSHIGQPYVGRIALQLGPDEQLSERCIRVIPDGGDLPSIGQAQVQLIERDAGATLVVRSYNAVGEPMVGFLVELDCGQIQWSRQFTVFLDPAPVPVEAPTTAVNVSPPVVTRGGRLMKEDTTLAELAARRNQPGTAAYRRDLARLQKANPDIGDPDATIPAGSRVVIPARPRPAPVSKPATSTASGVPAGPSLTLSEPGVAAGKPRLSAAPIKDANYIAELERKVALMEELQGKLELEVAQLQTRLNALNASTAALASATGQLAVASQAASPAAQAAAPVKPTAETAPKATPRYQAPGMGQLGWLALGGVVLGGLIGFWVWRMRRRRREDWDDDQIASSFAAARTAVMTQLAMRAARSKDERLTQQSQFRHTIMLNGIEVADADVSLMDRATLLISQGEIDEAIEVLQEAINESPKDVERWLMLFRLFRQQAMKSDYAILARRFLNQPHDHDDWELVRNIGARLDPENPLYERPAREAAPKAEPPRAEPDLALDAERALAAASGETPRAAAAAAEKDAELMDFFSHPDTHLPEKKPYGEIQPPEAISLDLPPLELDTPDKPAEGRSPIDQLVDKKSG